MLLIIALVDWVGVGMEVDVGRHAGQSQDWLAACREMTEHFQSAC